MEKNIKKYFPIFVLPTFLSFAVVFLIPFILGIYLSFTEFTTVDNAQWVGLDNYIKAFTLDENFKNALFFTIKFTIVSVVTINFISFFLALLLTKSIKGTNFFRTVFFMPNLIGGIVLGYIWNLLINAVLGAFGLDITYDARFGFWGLVFLLNWQLIGYMMVIYIAGLQNVPKELNEAAMIDGASSLSVLRNITIPMVMPAVTICLFLTLTNSFKLFDQNLALTGGAPARETSMLALDIYNTFYGRIGWQGVGQAKAVVFFLIVAIIAFVQLKITGRKEVEQ
jgi:raffinose/stachyose/melibiose transport system permease protein